MERYRFVTMADGYSGALAKDPDGDWVEWQDVVALKSQLAEAREALEFYAEDDNYYFSRACTSNVDDDHGAKAIEALKPAAEPGSNE